MCIKFSEWRLHTKCWVRCDRKWKHCLGPHVAINNGETKLKQNYQYLNQHMPETSSTEEWSLNLWQQIKQYWPVLWETIHFSVQVLQNCKPLTKLKQHLSLKIGKVCMYKKRWWDRKTKGKKNSQFHKYKLHSGNESCIPPSQAVPVTEKQLAFSLIGNRNWGHISNSWMIFASCN